MAVDKPGVTALKVQTPGAYKNRSPTRKTGNTHLQTGSRAQGLQAVARSQQLTILTFNSIVAGNTPKNTELWTIIVKPFGLVRK